MATPNTWENGDRQRYYQPVLDNGASAWMSDYGHGRHLVWKARPAEGLIVMTPWLCRSRRKAAKIAAREERYRRRREWSMITEEIT